MMPHISGLNATTAAEDPLCVAFPSRLRRQLSTTDTQAADRMAHLLVQLCVLASRRQPFTTRLCCQRALLSLLREPAQSESTTARRIVLCRIVTLGLLDPGTPRHRAGCTLPDSLVPVMAPTP